MWVTQKVHSPACRPQPRNGELEVGMAVLVGEPVKRERESWSGSCLAPVETESFTLEKAR